MRKVSFALSLFFGFNAIAQFSPGNIVVSRVGDGSTLLTNASAQVQLVEYTTAGVATGVVVTLPVTTTNTAGNRACTNSGSSTTEGGLNLSYDGRYLTHTGYDAIPGVTGISSSATDPNRTIARIDVSGNIDISTSFLATTGNAYVRNSIRSATTLDGTQFWASGTSSSTYGGVRYLTLGQDDISGVQISTTITNSRSVQIFNDQLYVSAQSSTIRVGSVGVGTPTTTGQTITNLPSLPTVNLSPNGFVFFDRDPVIAGVDLLYFVSQTNTANEFGLFKYSFDGTNWNSKGKLADATTNNSQASGLTGYLNCTGNVVLYLTRATGSAFVPSEIRTYTDNAVYNATMTSNGSSILSASTPLVPPASNYAFRGIAMSPANGYSVTGAQSVAAGNYNIIKVKSGGIATLTGNIVVYDKIVVESGGTLDLGAFTISSPSGIGSSFEVKSGGSIKIGSADGITASSALGNVQTCFRTYSAGANYEYTGIATQVTGNGLPSGLSAVLKINNTSGIATSGVTLSQATSITGSLNLTAGKLTTTATNLPTLDYSATAVLNASSTSFISGPVKKIGTNDFTFPVGVGSIYSPIGILNVSGTTAPTDAFTAEYLRINPQSLYGFIYAFGIDHISFVEHWKLTKNSGDVSLTKNVMLTVTAESFCKVLSTTFVSHLNGTLWSNEPSTWILTSTVPPFQLGNVTTIGGINTFSPFTLATSDPFAINPLPIKLLTFNAAKINSSLSNLTWELAYCCSSTAKFDVEKSTDGRNFLHIASISGSETNRFYTFNDSRLSKGVTYYRLKMIDVDGKISYSKVVAIISESKGLLITSIAPNPVGDNSSVSISTAKDVSVNFTIYDMMGRPVKQWQSNIAEGSNTISINTKELSTGIYHLAAATADAKTVMRFVKQ